MFRSAERLSDERLSRREWLSLGLLGTLASTLPTAARSPEQKRPDGAGKARACILLFPYGSPPQHEMFDPKPDAPAEIQGEIKSIPTVVPGVRLGELLPRTARILDRLTVVRSMSHPYPEHGVAYALSGIPTYTPALETRARDPQHWPFIGSVVDYLESKRTGELHPPMPRNIGLPWVLNSKTDMPIVNAGPFAAFLGQGHDPIWTDFDGKGTRTVPRYTDGQTKDFYDPFGGMDPEGRFRLGSDLPPDVSRDRLQRRQSLLQQLDPDRRENKIRGQAEVYGRHRQTAFHLLTSSQVRQALDLEQEPHSLRAEYGMTLFGQSCLAARRLVEAGCKFVTVFWDGFGQFANCAWDTHNNHYPRLKEYLLPGFDRAYPALIRDLEQRGLLRETLVLWMSEHGRTPKIDSKPKGAGRHHWSRAYSAVLAGGGTPAGKIVGSTDRHAGEVRDTPVSPKDLLATTLHLLGFDPSVTIPDLLNRPMPAVGAGKVRPELLA